MVRPPGAEARLIAEFPRSFVENVADIGSGDDVFRVAGGILYLFSPGVNSRLKNAATAKAFLSPDFGHKLVLSDHLTSIASQQTQNGVLREGQHNLSPLYRHLVMDEVYTQPARGEEGL